MEQDVTRALRREEKIILALRALYEQYGFRKYRMGKFEEYELYMENKNFLKNPNIITFHDLPPKRCITWKTCIGWKSRAAATRK